MTAYRRSDGPTTLYRFFDPTGTLVYVGITNRPTRRIGEHASDKPWWGEVATATLEHHPTRAAAEAAEAHAIRTEKPRFNVVHNQRGRVRAGWDQERLLREAIQRNGAMVVAGRHDYRGRVVLTLEPAVAADPSRRVRLVVGHHPVRALGVRAGDLTLRHPDCKAAAAVKRLFPNDWVLLGHEADDLGTAFLEIDRRGICTDSYPRGHYFTDPTRSAA